MSLLSSAFKPLPIPSSLLKAVSDPTTVAKVKVLAGVDTAARLMMTVMMLVSRESVTEGSTPSSPNPLMTTLAARVIAVKRAAASSVLALTTVAKVKVLAGVDTAARLAMTVVTLVSRADVMERPTPSMLNLLMMMIATKY